MEGLDVLTRALRRRTPRQLAALLDRHAEPLGRRPAPTTLRELASALWSYETLHHVVLHLDHPRSAVLATAAHLSLEHAADQAPAPADPGAGAGRQTLLAHRLSFARVASAPVPLGELHAALSSTPEDPARIAVDHAVASLCEDALAVLTDDGALLVPPRLPQLLGRAPGPLTAGPPRPPGPARSHGPDGAPDPGARSRVRDETQVAGAALATAADRLLVALAERPAAVRKAGGLTVREVRRLAGAAGVDEPRTRLLLDLVLAAGLVTLTRTPAGTTALPTAAYDDWAAAPPPDRVAPLLNAWADLWRIPTHVPPGETPTALVRGEDRHAPALRHALLAALAPPSDTAADTAPGGAPSGPNGRPGPQPEDQAARGARRPPAAPPSDEELAVTLLETAAWHRPRALEQPLAAERAACCLGEARFLGLVAHGCLTPLGRALFHLGEPASDHASPHLSPTRAPGTRALADVLRGLLPEPLPHAHFQSDGTATVPGTPTAALAALLHSTADREPGDAATTWRLTASSVRRALDAGHDGDTLRADLTAASATGDLPAGLVTLISDTARRHGRMRVVRTACCVRCDDPSLLEELLAHTALRPLGLRRIAPSVLVGSRDPEATLAALRDAGYAPTLEAETGATVVERTAGHRAATQPSRPVDRLAQARKLLDPAALAGDAAEVPAARTAPEEDTRP